MIIIAPKLQTENLNIAKELLLELAKGKMNQTQLRTFIGSRKRVFRSFNKKYLGQMHYKNYENIETWLLANGVLIERTSKYKFYFVPKNNAY